jgi:hypothetical protein
MSAAKSITSPVTKMAKLLTFLAHFREQPVSNIVQVIAYNDCDFL